jgi:predicted ATPase/DNA-binding winged helix-turn-helix (wHTH) protein
MLGAQALSLDGGRIRIDRTSRTVLVQGEVAHLGGRAFDLLDALIEQRERVIGKNELMDLVWPGLVVEENNLHVQITTLRKVLGRQALATVPGRGYRLALVVDEAGPGASSPPSKLPLPHAAAPAGAENALSAPAQARHALHGRAADLARLHADAAAGQCFTIVGSAGVGKTALARAWAVDKAAAGSVPVWVDLMPLRDGALLPGLVAEACGAAIAGASPWHMLAAAIKGRGVVIVLDNAEHLLAAVAAGARTLLENAPDAVLLVTSQAPLRIEREWVHRLEPLDVPAQGEEDGLASSQAQVLMQHSAVSCFVEQLRRADRRFEPDAAALVRVARLVRKLDGLPLALRLAAARVPLLGLAGVEQRLDQRLKLLAGAARDADPRHGSLSLALDWSHALLDGAVQAAFAALGVMQGEFPLELGAAVAAGPDGDEWAAIEIMAVLVDRSLLELVEGIEGVEEAQPRYRLLDSTHAYARERLRQSGRLADVSRHAAALLTGRFAALGERDPVFLARLHADADNALAALGQWRLAIERAERSSHLLALEHHLGQALDILRRPAFISDAQHRPERLALLLRMGSVNGLTHGLAAGECEAAFNEATVVAEEEGSLEGRFIALFNLVFTHAMRLEHEAARRLLDEVVKLADESGDPRLQLQAEHAIYSGSLFRGDMARTVNAAESGYRRYRAPDSAYHCRHFVGHDPGLCALGHAAAAHFISGNLEQSDLHARRLRELLATHSHPPSLIVGNSIQVWLLWMEGRVAQAREVGARMVALSRRLHIPLWVAYFTILEGVASISESESPNLSTVTRLVEVLERVRAAGTRFRMPSYRVWIAEACAVVRDVDLGLAQVDLALREMGEQREWMNHALALAVRASLHEQRSDLDRARADWLAALASAESRGMGLYALRAATGLAALDAREGHHEAALRGLTQALRPFRDEWQCTMLSEARALLARLAPGGAAGLRAVT